MSAVVAEMVGDAMSIVVETLVVDSWVRTTSDGLVCNKLIVVGLAVEVIGVIVDFEVKIEVDVDVLMFTGIEFVPAVIVSAIFFVSVVAINDMKIDDVVIFGNVVIVGETVVSCAVSVFDKFVTCEVSACDDLESNAIA